MVLIKKWLDQGNHPRGIFGVAVHPGQLVRRVTQRSVENDRPFGMLALWMCWCLVLWGVTAASIPLHLQWPEFVNKEEHFIRSQRMERRQHEFDLFSVFGIRARQDLS